MIRCGELRAKLAEHVQALRLAEAEVERLKERLALETHWAQTFQAERDRYKVVVDAARRFVDTYEKDAGAYREWHKLRETLRTLDRQDNTPNK